MVAPKEAVGPLLVYVEALRGKVGTGPEQIEAMHQALIAYEAAKPIDYRLLLAKYVRHVGNREGCDFIEYTRKSSKTSDLEWAELEKIAAEVEDNRRGE